MFSAQFFIRNLLVYCMHIQTRCSLCCLLLWLWCDMNENREQRRLIHYYASYCKGQNFSVNWQWISGSKCHFAVMILYKDARESTKSDAGNCNREVCPAHTQLIHWPQKPRLSQNESERWYSCDLQYTLSTTVLFYLTVPCSTRRTETFVSMNNLSLLLIYEQKIIVSTCISCHVLPM